MKRRTIITSVLVIVLCLGLISGSTFALFTSESSVNIAVTSGKVNVVATLKDLAVYSATADTVGLSDAELDDEAGTLTGTFAGTYYYKVMPVENNTKGTFANGGTAKLGDPANVLTIDKITPGDKVAVKVDVKNNSNVAIQYRVRVNVLEGDDAAASYKLFKGLNVDIGETPAATDNQLNSTIRVSEWTPLAAETAIDDIPVEIYLPLDAGNEYQGLTTKLLLTVEAVQGNANTSTLAGINAKLKASEQKNATMYDAIQELANYSYSYDDLKGYVWSVDNDLFYAESDVESSFEYRFFKVYTEIPDTQTFSIYADPTWNTNTASVDNLTVGFDVGATNVITSVTYDRSTATTGRDVVIRTNGGTLTVDAKNDTVQHYGEAQVVTLTAVGDHSYYERGSVNLVDVKKGRLVITNDAEAEVGSIYLTATNDGYDGIILATMNGATLPELVAREAVGLPTEGQKKLVAVVEQVNSNGVADASKTENIYLYAAQTTYEETKGYTGVSELGTLVLEAPGGTGSFTITVKEGNTEKEVTVTVADLDESVTKTKTATLEEATSAAVKFAGGNGTQEKPYIIANANQWNNFYQMVYDANLAGKTPYFELANDINLEGVKITNYAVNNNNEKVYDHEMNFVLDGKGHSVLNIETLMGYKQPFPYIVDTTIKNITIDYNLVNRTQTCAMTYNCFGDCYFINVTTTGKIETTANWATAFVAYPWHSNVYYTNCTNRANLTTNFTSNSYVAPFGSHNGGEEVHIYFDNCKNFGNIAGGHVGGFVGMGNNDHFNFKDENAVKNYGSLTYSSDYGYFQINNTSDTFKTNNTNVTCTVKQSGSSSQKLATLSVNNPANGEKLVINNVEGATRYVVTVSSAVQVYNYDDSGNANKWSGGFPRSIVGEYAAESGETTETAFINVALKENRDTRLNYQTGEEVAYNGLFVDEQFDIESSDVTVLLGDPEKDPFVLVSYKGEVFYYFMNGQYNGLVSDGATSITLRFDVTAYNGDIVLGTLDTYSYTYSIGE